MNKIQFCISIILVIAVASIGAGITYFVSALITSQIAANLCVSLIAFWVISFLLTRPLVGSLVRNHPDRSAAIISLAAAFILIAVISFPTLKERFSHAPNNASDSVVRALQQYTVAIETVHAERGFNDLQPLKSFWAEKRIVALGEATHGTSEFFRMKHRMLEFLVCEMDYENFGMETSADVAKVINDYIAGRNGNPKDVLYWPWATVEVMDMLDWMRAYNADPGTTRKLTFYGIDPGVGDRDRVMAENVEHLLEQLGPDSKIVLWAHNAHISNANGWMGHYLKQKFSDQAYLIGFEFNHGSFTSRMATIHTYSVGPASPAYYAHELMKAGKPILFLDFRTMVQNQELRKWLEKGQSSTSFKNCTLYID